jgi:hypothetical protein
MEQGTFEKGYIAGWRSVRGAEDLPLNVPPSPMRIPAGSYMLGFSRALRDASDTRGMESWDARVDGGGAKILARGPRPSLRFPNQRPPSDKKRTAPHAGHH